MKHIKDLTVIKSIVDDISGPENLIQGQYAAGFAFTDFFLWNLASDSKVFFFFAVDNYYAQDLIFESIITQVFV